MPLLGAMLGRHCWVPLLGIVGWHGWMPLLRPIADASYQLWRGSRWVPLLAAVAGVPLLGTIAAGAIAGCHAGVLLGTIVGRHCWVPCSVPLLGAMQGCCWVPWFVKI